jgi:tape measure domain-containing protein
MATEILELQVRATGTSQAKGELDKIASAGKLAAETMTLLRNALVLVGAVRIAQNFIEFVDSFDQITDRVRPFTTGAQQLNGVLAALGFIAQESAQKLDKVSEVYIALAGSTSNLHLSQQQVIQGTRDFVDILVASGKSIDDAKASVTQFGLGLSTGALSGRALTSILRDARPVAIAIANEFHTTAGALQAMVKQNPGILESSRVFKALREAGADAQKKLGDVVDSISDGFQRIATAAQYFFGRLAEATGVGKSGLDFLSLLAQNIDKVVLTVAGLVVLGTIGFVFSNLATIIGTVVFGVKNLVSFLSILIPVVNGVAGVISVLTSVMLANPIIAGTLVLGIAALLGYLALTQTSLASLIPTLDGVKHYADIMIAAFVTGVATIVEGWHRLPGILAEIGIDAANGLIQALELIVKGALSIMNQVVGIFSLGFGQLQPLIQGKIDSIKFGQFENNFTGSIRRASESISSTFNAVLSAKPVESAINFVSRNVTSLLDTLHSFTIPKNLPVVPGGVAPGSGSGAPFSPKVDPHAADKIQQLRDQIEQAIGRFDPYIEGIAKIDKFHTLLGKNTAVTNEILAKLGITEEEVNRRMLRDIVGVGNAVTDMRGKIKLLDEQTAAGNITQEERAKALRQIAGEANSIVESISPLIAAQNKLADQTLALNDAQAAGVKLGLSQDEIMKRLARDAVGVGNAAVELADKTTLLNDAWAKGYLSMQEYEQQLRKLQIAYLDTQTDATSGFQRGILKVQQEYLDTSKEAESTITDLFSNLSSTMEDFFKNGKLNFSKLIDGILSDLTKLAIKGAITGPLSKLLGGGGYSGSTGNETDPFGGIFSAITNGFSSGTNTMTSGLKGTFDQNGQQVVSGMGDAFTNQGGSFLSQLGSLFSSIFSGGSSGGSGGFDFGSLFGGGGGSGGGGFFDNLFGGGGGGGEAFTGWGFDSGGSMMVGGEHGRDKNLLNLKVSRGERVDVLTPDQQARDAAKKLQMPAPTVNFYITTPDADSFRRSQSQIGVMAANGLQRAQKRNG